jgi:hypothetical protein
VISRMFVSVAGAGRRDSRAFCSCDYLIGRVKRVWLFLAFGYLQTDRSALAD